MAISATLNIFSPYQLFSVLNTCFPYAEPRHLLIIIFGRTTYWYSVAKFDPKVVEPLASHIHPFWRILLRFSHPMKCILNSERYLSLGRWSFVKDAQHSLDNSVRDEEELSNLRFSDFSLLLCCIFRLILISSGHHVQSINLLAYINHCHGGFILCCAPPTWIYKPFSKLPPGPDPSWVPACIQVGFQRMRYCTWIKVWNPFLLDSSWRTHTRVCIRCTKWIKKYL